MTTETIQVGTCGCGASGVQLFRTGKCAHCYIAELEAKPAKLQEGDDCPKCGSELMAVSHRYDSSGGAPDCDWLACLDCGFATDPE